MSKVIDVVETENNPKVIWIEREMYFDGKRIYTSVYVPAWANAKDLVAAAKKIARLTW